MKSSLKMLIFTDFHTALLKLALRCGWCIIGEDYRHAMHTSLYYMYDDVSQLLLQFLLLTDFLNSRHLLGNIYIE